MASDNSNVVYIGTSDSTVYIPGNLIVTGSFTANTGLEVDSRSGRTTLGGVINGTIHSSNNTDYFGNYYLVRDKFFSYIPDYSLIYSDRRLKNIKGENLAGLGKIRELKVYDYTLKNDKEKTPHVGVIAQDLQKVFPTAVTKDDEGYFRIRWDEMFYALINAVKELDKYFNQVMVKITGLETKIKALEAENKSLKQQNANLNKQILDINKRLDKLEKSF